MPRCRQPSLQVAAATPPTWLRSFTQAGDRRPAPCAAGRKAGRGTPGGACLAAWGWAGVLRGCQADQAGGVGEPPPACPWVLAGTQRTGWLLTFRVLAPSGKLSVTPGVLSPLTLLFI